MGSSPSKGNDKKPKPTRDNESSQSEQDGNRQQVQGNSIPTEPSSPHPSTHLPSNRTASEGRGAVHHQQQPAGTAGLTQTESEGVSRGSHQPLPLQAPLPSQLQSHEASSSLSQRIPGIGPVNYPRDRSRSAAPPFSNGRLEPIHHPTTAGRSGGTSVASSPQQQAPNSAPLRGMQAPPELWPPSPSNVALPPSFASVPTAGELNQNPDKVKRKKKKRAGASSTPPQDLPCHDALQPFTARNWNDPSFLQPVGSNNNNSVVQGPLNVSPPPPTDSVKRTPRPLPLDPTKLGLTPSPPPPPAVTNDSNSTPSSSASPNRRAPTSAQRPAEQEVLLFADLDNEHEDAPSAQFRFERNNSVVSELLTHLRGSSEWGSSTTNPRTPPLHPQPRPPQVSPAGSDTSQPRSHGREMYGSDPLAQSLPLPSPQPQQWEITPPAVNRPLALSMEQGSGGGGSGREDGAPMTTLRRGTAPQQSGSTSQQLPLSARARHASTPSGATQPRSTRANKTAVTKVSNQRQYPGAYLGSPFQAPFDDQDESSDDEEGEPAGGGGGGVGPAKSDAVMGAPMNVGIGVSSSKLVPVFAPGAVATHTSTFPYQDQSQQIQPRLNANTSIAAAQMQDEGTRYNVPPPATTLPSVNQASIDRPSGFGFNTPPGQNPGFQVVARKNAEGERGTVPSRPPPPPPGGSARGSVAPAANTTTVTSNHGRSNTTSGGARFQTLSRSSTETSRSPRIVTPPTSPSLSASTSGAWSGGLTATAKLAAAYNGTPIPEQDQKKPGGSSNGSPQQLSNDQLDRKSRGILQCGRRSTSVNSTPTSGSPSGANNVRTSRARSQQGSSSQGTPVGLAQQEQPLDHQQQPSSTLTDPTSSLIEVFSQEMSVGVAQECVGPHSSYMEKRNSEQYLFHLSLPSPAAAAADLGDPGPPTAGSSTSAGAGELLRHFSVDDDDPFSGSLGRGLSETGTGAGAERMEFGFEFGEESESTPPPPPALLPPSAQLLPGTGAPPPPGVHALQTGPFSLIPQDQSTTPVSPSVLLLRKKSEKAQSETSTLSSFPLDLPSDET